MDIGFPTAQDCRVDGLDSRYPILNRLVAQSPNVDELDYLINLTFCCQQATVVTDFSRLEQAGKDRALAINGGAMSLKVTV